jgi:uncharacterized protein
MTQEIFILAEFYELPLFPLSTVLFPGMLLPLHIFEERYKIMVHHCLTHNEPFGVVFIRDGHEVGGNADIVDVGTTAHITNVNHMEDGRMNITTVGISRFKVQGLDPIKEPYLTGTVENFPLDEGNPESVRDETRYIQPLLAKYLSILAKVSKAPTNIDHFPKDASTLAYLTAIILQMPLPEKQSLLAIPSLLEMLRQERKLLKEESKNLQLLLQNIPKWRDNNPLFSPN